MEDISAVAIYCIDTSALIHGWQRDYPPDTFPRLWMDLSELANKGDLIAPDEVLLELERGGDDLHDWAEEQSSGLFLSLDEPVQQVVAEIVNRWPTFIPRESRDGVWADPYVVGLAKTRGATVVTGEVAVGPGAKRLKIPNVCAALAVPHTTLLGLIRNEKWRY